MDGGASGTALRFTTVSASWTTAGGGLFSKVTRQRLKNAVFDPLDERVAAIYGSSGTPTGTGPARPLEPEAGGACRVMEKRLPDDRTGPLDGRETFAGRGGTVFFRQECYHMILTYH